MACTAAQKSHPRTKTQDGGNGHEPRAGGGGAGGHVRAARRLHLRPPRQGLAAASFVSPRAIVPFLGGGGGAIKKVLSSSKSKRRRKAEEDELSFEWEEDGVWRKEIMMGERCQPLEFSGAIYYDAEGRRLEQPPTPRSPLRSPLPASVVLKANA
ncbi:unnamed protein product [Urochloa humidicola]